MKYELTIHRRKYSDSLKILRSKRAKENPAILSRHDGGWRMGCPFGPNPAQIVPTVKLLSLMIEVDIEGDCEIDKKKKNSN